MTDETTIVKFQSLDWDSFHSEDDSGKKQFVIQCFGKTKDQKTIYLEITDFKPFFFLNIPDNWGQKIIDSLIEEMRNKIRVPRQNEDGETQWIKSPDSLVEMEIVEKCKFWGFSNQKKHKFIKLSFDDHDSMKACERTFKHAYKLPGMKYPIKMEVFESNIHPLLRMIHMRELESCGWIYIPKNQLIEETDQTSCCDLNYSTSWTNVSNINKIKEDRSIEKFIICAFDIECTSTDGSFPQPTRDGDMVIQIGLTLSRYGEEECYEKHLLALYETSQIEGVHVQWFNTEEELLLAFTKLLRKLQFDILTGFNIFGFDCTYLKKRCEFLASKMPEAAGKKFINNFSKMSRINHEISEWKEQKLASSALGENILRYWKMTGRVIIDLMKTIQANPMYRLSSYKLDSVASHFIRESVTGLTRDQMRTAKDKVKKITKFSQSSSDEEKKIYYRIETKNTYGLNIHDYVTISYGNNSIEEKYNNGEKFKIIELEKKYMIVEGNIDTNEFMGKGYKIFWSQSKDDLKVSEIFSKFKQSPEDRAIIGKYCIMDCVLCNKLMAKLQVITNNVGMANVCHVPLSYLFLRGQGIKIFSLVAKKTREKDHLMRVIKKDPATGKSEASTNHQIPTKKVKNIDDLDDKMLEKFTRELNYKNIDIAADDDEGYEGAIVFEPNPGVYYEPVPVLDFASLYPNAMILRNLSHETLVTDPSYENIEGFKYHTIWYKKNNGDLVTCKFAEKKEGIKGIIPEILMDLLAARKKYKKLMNAEKEGTFQYFILDGLQQAYKVTANSLYGQTGATTSPVCMKEIAASTTATGREMLQFSKYFIENIYSKLINLALTNKKKYLEDMKEVFLYHPTEFEVKDNDGNDIMIHVNTDQFDKISDKKFIRKTIGYEKKIEFADMDMTAWNKIFEVLSTISPKERTKFKIAFKSYILDEEDCCTTAELYTEFESIWNKAEINDKKELRTNIVNVIEDPDNFVENLELVIDEMGYNNKEQFYEKFYETMNELLVGHSIDAKIIYGDSVTGDTPLLLRDSNNNIVIETIENLGKSWTKCDLSGKLYDNSVNYEIWTDQGWTKIRKVLKHRTNKKIYEVLTHTGCVRVTEDHSLLDKLGNRITPNECKVGTELLHSFPKPISFEDTLYNHIVKTNDSKKALETYYRYSMLGYCVYVDKNEDTYSILISDEIRSIGCNKIKKITEVQYNEDQYAYDLETENHHFHAGVGELIVHNTDSVFFCAHIKDEETGELLQNDKGLCIGIRLGIWASILITTLLPAPMAQEYEKVLWPFIIQGKKRYVGNLYEKDPKSFKQKSMGIELKRRDNAQIVKTVSAGIIHKILNERDPKGAYEFMRDMLKKITAGQFPMDKFVITKTLKGNALTKAERIKESKKEKDQRAYVDRTRIVHAVLADRMADRDPGNRPLSNDRIPYVYTVIDGEPDLQGDRVETPEYIIEHNLKIDYLFYITNQIMKPALRFLDLITTNAESLFKDYIAREQNRKNGMLPMAYYAEEYENTEIDNYFEDNDSDSDEVVFVVKKIKKVTKKKTKVNVNEKDDSKAIKTSAEFAAEFY